MTDGCWQVKADNLGSWVPSFLGLGLAWVKNLGHEDYRAVGSPKEAGATVVPHRQGEDRVGLQPSPEEMAATRILSVSGVSKRLSGPRCRPHVCSSSR